MTDRWDLTYLTFRCPHCNNLLTLNEKGLFFNYKPICPKLNIQDLTKWFKVIKKPSPKRIIRKARDII